MVGVGEGGNVRVGDAGGLHDLPLVRGGACLGLRLGLFRHELGGIGVLRVGGSLGRLLRGSLGLRLGVDDGEHGRVSVLGDLVLDLVRGRLDGHARAVEREGEEGLVALEAMVCGRELELGQREGVAEVQHAVHVRVREVTEELGGLGA